MNSIWGHKCQSSLEGQPLPPSNFLSCNYLTRTGNYWSRSWMDVPDWNKFVPRKKISDRNKHSPTAIMKQTYDLPKKVMSFVMVFITVSGAFSVLVWLIIVRKRRLFGAKECLSSVFSFYFLPSRELFRISLLFDM